MEAKDGGDALLGNGASIPVELTGSQYTNISNEPTPENKIEFRKEVEKWINEIITTTLKNSITD